MLLHCPEVSQVSMPWREAVPLHSWEHNPTDIRAAIESKRSSHLIEGQQLREFPDVVQEVSADVFQIAEYECLLYVEAASNDILCILQPELMRLLKRQFILKQRLLVIRKHNHYPKLATLNTTPNCFENIPSGTSNTSCNHFVNVNGMVCPKCSASLDGPRPVYKKNGSPASYLSRILSKSRCEKNKPLRNQRCGFFPVSRSNRCSRSSSINFVAHFLNNFNHCVQLCRCRKNLL